MQFGLLFKESRKQLLGSQLYPCHLQTVCRSGCEELGSRLCSIVGRFMDTRQSIGSEWVRPIPQVGQCELQHP